MSQNIALNSLDFAHKQSVCGPHWRHRDDPEHLLNAASLLNRCAAILLASAYSASARFLHLTAVGPSWPMRGNLDTSKSKRIQPAKRRSVGNAQRKKVAAESEIQRGTTRSNSNQATVIALLSHPQGTTVSMIMKTTGWQQHSVRGFLAGDVRKRLGLTLESEKSDGERHYRIVARKSLGSGAEDADRHAA